MPGPSHDKKILILGIGNLLWADEGFGVRAVETLNRTHDFPAEVSLMDGGTQGMFLLPHIQQATHLLLFDAIDFGLAPGALRIIRDGDVPRYLGAKKLSMHQTGFQEVLESARLLEHNPEKITLIGVQPVEINDYGGPLREQIEAQIPRALTLGLLELKKWGVTPR